MQRGKSVVYWVLAGGITAGTISFATTRGESPLQINAGVCGVVETSALAEIGVVPRKLRLSSVSDAQAVAGLLKARASKSNTSDVEGEWVMRGKIDAGAASALRRRLSQAPAPTRLRITSAGGDERAAIDMAYQIADHGLPIIVDTLCGSACANYLLPAAPRVELDGLVLMHGSPAACAARLGIWDGLRQMGWRGFWLLRAAAQRQHDFEKRHPWFKDLVERSALPDRGDPTGATHDWRQVPPAELVAAHPALTVGDGHAKALTGHQALQQQAPKLAGNVYFP